MEAHRELASATEVQYLQKVFIHLDLLHFVVLQPKFKMDSIFFTLTHLHTIPHNDDKVKTCF